jgi:cysteinyl-tRNA synthetase
MLRGNAATGVLKYEAGGRVVRGHPYFGDQMIKLHDTMTGEKREFTPLHPNRVTVYQCGPTVYDHPHLGNGRPAAAFDILFRLLRHTYGEDSVFFARNYTDIDDKIIERAKERNISISELTNETIQVYHSVMRMLGNLDPTLNPRATTHIGVMIEMITTLIDKGHAYVADGHVLFSVKSHAQHGKLSKQNLLGLQAGARVEPGSYKRDPADFVLWKPGKEPGEPVWTSPWGMGRPGWHIECSAMIARIFGPTIDIHGGGSDLIFPHHENEIAQSECAHGEPLANYWLHNGMLTVDGKKMSKSQGNFVTLAELMKSDLDGEVVRYFLLSTHYRAAIDYTEARMEEAEKALNGLYTAVLNGKVAGPPDVDESVLGALQDDLNTPGALAALHDLASRVSRGEESVDKLLRSANMMGLLESDPTRWRQRKTDTRPMFDIWELIQERNSARANKDWAEADRLRAKIESMGVVLEDKPEGTVWRSA